MHPDRMMPLSAFREFFPGGWHVSKAILSGILRWEKRGDRVFWERSATRCIRSTHFLMQIITKAIYICAAPPINVRASWQTPITRRCEDTNTIFIFNFDCPSASGFGALSHSRGRDRCCVGTKHLWPDQRAFRPREHPGDRRRE